MGVHSGWNGCDPSHRNRTSRIGGLAGCGCGSETSGHVGCLQMTRLQGFRCFVGFRRTLGGKLEQGEAGQGQNFSPRKAGVIFYSQRAYSSYQFVYPNATDLLPSVLAFVLVPRLACAHRPCMHPGTRRRTPSCPYLSALDFSSNGKNASRVALSALGPFRLLRVLADLYFLYANLTAT